jgi:hypothetical protein
MDIQSSWPSCRDSQVPGQFLTAKISSLNAQPCKLLGRMNARFYCQRFEDGPKRLESFTRHSSSICCAALESCLLKQQATSASMTPDFRDLNLKVSHERKHLVAKENACSGPYLQRSSSNSGEGYRGFCWAEWLACFLALAGLAGEAPGC